jgi:hypothetical protein
MGDSGSLFKKAYLRPAGRGFNSMGSLGGSSKKSKGSGTEG